MANKRRNVVDLSSAFAGLDKLGTLAEPVARAMGVEMADVVQVEAKIRAPVLDPTNKGTDNQQPGVLRRAIYKAFDNRAHVLAPRSFKYNVSWNSKIAPHGHLLEFGHEMPYLYARNMMGEFYTPAGLIPQPNGPVWVSAAPFLGPAFDAKQRVLLNVAVQAGGRKFRELLA